MISEIISLTFPKVEDDSYNSFIKNELENYLISKYDAVVLVKPSHRFSLFMSHDISDCEYEEVRSELLRCYNALIIHKSPLSNLIK